MNENVEVIEVDTSKRVKSIKISAIAKNCTGKMNITDIMLQSGSMGISWNAHPSEIRWVVNEDD